jgi:hypothetical protein
MVADDSDEMLGARLDSALRAGTDLDQVDVTALLQGSRRRAGRLRSQRIAGGIAAAILVVGIPVGYEMVNPGAGGAPPAALLPSSSRPAVTGTADPTVHPNPATIGSAAPTASESVSTRPPGGSTAPTGSPTGGPTPSGPTGGPTAIPDAFAFTAAELPTGLVLKSETPNPGPALVEGQTCTTGATARAITPTLARRWVWSSGQSTDGDLSVSLTVTRWAKGMAPTMFQAAFKATDYCTWPAAPTPQAAPELSSGQSWAATSEVNGQHYGLAAVQLGDGIVGIQVRHPKTADAAVAIAKQLASAQAARLRNGILASPR